MAQGQGAGETRSGLTEPVLPRRRSPTPRVKLRFVRTADLREAALMLLYAMTVLLLPIGWWPAVADVMHRARHGLKQRHLPRYQALFRAVYGKDISSAVIRAWYRDLERHADRKRLYTVASHLAARWRPRIVLSGDDRIAVALAEGRGVILWFDGFVHTNLLAKMALKKAGYEMHFLSSKDHGVSLSSFGRTFLNPVYVKAEARHLSERIVLGESNQVGCTRRMRTVLRQNGIVGVTNTVSSNMPFVDTPFGASAHLALPTTILNLSLTCGAPILPVSTVETKPLRDYAVVIGPVILPEASADRDAAMTLAARRYADWLLPLVRDYPEQWTGWKSDRLI